MLKRSISLLSRSICRLCVISCLPLFLVGCTATIQTAAEPLTQVLPVAHTPTSITGSISTPAETPLSVVGPWLIFLDGNKLYAVNKDGTGLTSLTPDLSFWQVTNTPTTNVLAAITSKNNKLSYALSFIRLPQGRVIREIPLLSYYDTKPASFDDGPSGPLNGILGRDPAHSIVRSPDRRYLAFMGAIENSFSSLYVYDTNTQTVRRLSQNKYQAVNPEWSPDGKWIVYEEVSDFHGWQTEGIWAASVDGEKTKLLYKPENRVEQKILGWAGSDRFVVADRGMDGERNIRMVNIQTGIINTLYAGYYFQAAMDKNGAIAFSPFPGAPGASAELGPGLYLVSLDMSNPKLIANTDVPLRPFLTWDSSAELFVSEVQCNNEPGKIIAFDLSGKTMCIAKPPQNVSPNRSWYIEENEELSVYKTDGEKLGDVAGKANSIIWSPDSEGFFFIGDKTLYHVSLPDLAFRSIANNEYRYSSIQWIGLP